MPKACSSWVSRNGAVQMFFSATKQKHICWKIFKVRKVFGCVAGAYYFQCQLKSCSLNEWGCLSQLYRKVSHLFCSFCWIWDFLLENLKLKKSLWRCPLERVDKYKKPVWWMPKIIFSKKEFQVLDFKSFIFWSKFRF